MERFFSPLSVECYRKLRNIPNNEPQRRLILAFLAAQERTIHAKVDSELRVRVVSCGDKYIWELHQEDHHQPVKFSVPIYLSKEAAHAAGNEARAFYLKRLAARARH